MVAVATEARDQLGRIEAGVEYIVQRLDSMEERISGLEDHVNGLNTSVAALDATLSTSQWWAMAIMAGLAVFVAWTTRSGQGRKQAQRFAAQPRPNERPAP